MRIQRAVAAGILGVSASLVAATASGQQALPVRNGRPIVAAVSGDGIFLDALLAERGPSADLARLRQGRATAEDLEFLDRLITIKLVAREAATMGLDESGEIRKQVEVTSREIMREVLIERLVKDLKPDPAAVETQFRELVREWKTASLLFQDEAAAQRTQKELAGGAAFADVAGRVVGARLAKSDSDDLYHQKKDYLPAIADALAKLRAGQVSPVITIPAGFVLMKVVDIRYPENAEARAQATQSVSGERQRAVLNAHDEALRRQYAVVNQAVLASLDYAAAKPGIGALLKDKRVVAEIKGGASVTVGDLTDYLRMQFFHGGDQAKEGQRMNAKKNDALNATVGRRLLNMEALKLGIDKTDAYRDRVTGYRESLVFNTFIQKVITPGNKMTEEEVKAYYNGHLKEYSTPEMIKLRGLAFARRDAAEAAMKKLREGTDFGWLAANASGQVGGGAPGLLKFDGTPVMTSSMPDALQGALVAARAKDVRLYAGPAGHFYVLLVQQLIPSRAKPYAEVREEIAKKLYGEKLNKSLKDYAGKLRAQSKVEVYLKRMP
jgi:hypothetical protein